MPRAFAHDARGTDKHLLVTERGNPRIGFTQAGEFDREILCHLHESMLQPFDDYAVDFVRSWRETAKVTSQYCFKVEGVRSELLVRFAASVIWRHAVSTRSSVDIGRFEPKLRPVVYGNSPVEVEPALVLYALQDDILTRRELDSWSIPPNATPKGTRRGYGFGVGGLNFVLQTDSRAVEHDIRAVSVNGKSSIHIVNRPFANSSELDGIAEMIGQIKAAQDRRERRGGVES